ncbi:LPXTG-motif cell wall anchor domain-containing protein [Eubacterium ruminantium]|nr:LPXTG-motif cell wall anchor domain-containing protein [Eubacterium ruminantium]
MKKKRVLAMLLAISLIIPNVYVCADNPDDGTPGDATVISSEEVTTEEEKTTEKEESKESSFTTPVEDVDTTLIDFSSRELLIGTEDPSIFTWDTEVVSEYNGIYLTRYENEEVTKNAYTYYYDKADFVDANVVFTVQDKEETEGEDLLQLNEGDDAISNLNDMDRSQELPTGTIAVIDTGSDGSDNVIEAVSVIGDTTSDDNGHGTKVIGAISSVYPEAKILSIKALGSDGKGDTASIYAAISYAIERKAGIINLSVSSLGIADSDVIKEVIDNAVAQGIIVVGAAGNNGKNAKYYVPGGIDSAIIVGSYNNDAEKNGNSNYGPTVDYYLKADSTSVASAKMSAVIAKDGISQIEESKENGFIYRPSPDDLKDETEIIEYMHNNSVYFEGADSIHAGVDAPSWYDAVKTYITDTLGMTIDIDYGYWSASSVTYNEVCATLVSRIINNSYPNEFHIEGSSSAPTLYNQLKSSTKWEEITNSDTWYYHNNLYTNGNWLTKIRPGDVIIWGDETNDPPTQSSTLPLSQVAATHAEIATYWGCAYNNGEGEDYDPYYGYRKWADWDYRNRNGVDGYTSAGQYFKVFRPVDAKDYYIAIKKIDARSYVMNGVSFTVSYHNNDTNSDVTIKGEYRDGKYYGIWTGFMNNEANQVPKNYLETANEGVGVFYLGKFSNTPTEIRVTENWSGRSDEGSAWAGGRAELVTQLKTETQAKKSHSVYSYEYAPNTSSKSLAAYNTEAEAISSAQVDAASQNPKYLYKNWHFAYATMVKKPDNETFAKNNPQYTFDGITYGLYGNSSCTELIATVKLTANGDKTEGYIKNLKDITINKTTTDNGSEPYRTTINGVHGIGGLMYGNYWWKEISTNNSGYKLDTTPHQITVSASHTEDYYKFTDTDSMEMGKIRVRKLLTGNGASGTSPAGATYRIWSTTFEWESTFTIGTDGYSPYKDLVYGTYKIQETGVPTAKPANGTWTIDSKIYTVVLKKGGGTDTVNSEVHVESENATVESTDKAVLNYYVAVKKVDNNGNPMNGITFDITINGTTHTKALKTGQYYDGSSYSTTNVPNGVAIYFVGSYETTPSVSVTENWTEKWSKNRYVHDTTTKSTAAGSLTIYNTKADAQSHAASFTYTNYGYGFATMHKDPAITTNLSLAGIQYQLRRCRNGNGVTVDQLVATVTLNASGKISDVTLSDMNCWTETLNGETCIGGLTYGNQSGTNNYYWVESQSNANYYPNTTKYYITVNKSNAIKPGTDASKYPLDAYTFTPASATGTDSPRTYLYLTKASSNPDCTDGNPNYSLEGATYKLYKSRAEAETALTSKNYGTALATFNVKANGTSVVNGTTTVNLDVSQWMNQNPLTGLFLNTTFYLVESAAGKNYLRSTEIASVQVTPANTSANPAHAEMTDKPVNDPFSIELIKTDKITGSNVLPKDKTLEGAKFKVDFYAADIETVLANANGNVASYLKSNYSPVADYSSEVTIAKNNAGQYYALINNDGTEYPLGFLVITEIQPPTDYKLEGAEQYIRKGTTKTKVTGNLAFVTYRQFDNDQTTYEEKTYYPNNATTLAELTSSSGTRHGINVSVEGWNIKVDNQPIRGDVRLTKVTYADGTPLESVEFVIKNLDTGEEHSIFTDAQGNATTVGNEDAWFSKSTDDNDPIPYTAGYGALPAGNYTITEKRSEANEKYQLLASEPFVIDSESTILIAASDNKLYNIEMPYLTTTAMDEATLSKSLAQGETATIIDTIKYYHLRANSKFYIVGTLMVRYPDGTYEAYQKDGEPYTVTSEAINTPAAWTKSEFEIDGEYVMEFPDVDPAGYEGCRFVVFQKLYYNAVPTDDANAKQYKEYAGTDEKIFPVLHEDIESEGQTVRPVDIHTNATDGITSEHISKPEGTVTIVDRVSYTGLTVGEEYTISGTLHVTGYTWKDAEGNEIKTVDADDTLLDEEGQPVTAETTFTAESKDGFVDLEFTIDASFLAGESVVAFEELIYKDKTIALHADIDDEDQTVHFGNLHTTLYRGGTEEWAEDFDEDDITKVTTVDESSKEVMAAEDAVVVDRIKYHNLLANRHYVIKGILMDKETKEPFVDADGNTVEVTYEFDTPEVEAVEDTDSPNSVKYICADGTELDMSADYADYLVDGYADVEFPKFNGTGMDGKTLVAYEEIYIVYTDEATGEEEEALVAEHKDIDDVDQTVRFPEIHTNANVEETNTKMVPIDGPVTINDTVTYKNLVPGKEYTLSATLVVKGDTTGTYEDGDALLDKDGKPITAEITFIPDNTDGEVVVPITFDGYLMPEVEIVCFENLSNDKGLDIAVHNDIEDKDQTTDVVKVHTTAKTEGTDGQDTLATEETVIIDTVAYEKLVPGLTYKLKGVLMQKSTGKELLGKDGKPITAEIEFVPEKSEGTVDMTFPAFDAVELALAGDSVVVFEKIYLVKTTEGTGEGEEDKEEEILIGHHEDIEDEGQTIYIPEIHTTASDSETGDHVGTVSEKATIIDKVEYKNLIVGKKYTVKGKLMVKETGKPLKVDGKEVTAEKTFTAKTADGFVELEFTFDSSALEGKTVVAFEDIYRDEYHVGTHTDIEDEDQTIDFPKVKTKAEDAVTKENIGEAGKETTIIDTVSYWNLIVGKKYTVKGVLMVQDTGETLLVDGQPVRAEKTFTAKTKDGTIELEFTFDSSALEGKTLIVFEDLYHNNIRVCGHTDINDEDQSEHHPGVKTTATDGKTGEHVGKAAKEVTIIDTVEYKNLLIGKKYTVKGKLMDKDTGKEFLVNGKAVTAEKTFTAEKANGTVELIFKFDGSALEGKAVVVFEDIFYKGIRVGTHTDINDEGQTVYYPSVKTHVEDQTKRVQPVENVTVVDDVMYSKLKVGEKYQLLGVLVDKKTGKNIMVDGLPVRVTKLFTAEAEDGMITMEFHFDATGLEGDVTVFEYLSLVKDVDNKDLNYYLVAEHTDLNDTEQTFMISPIPKTGDDTPVKFIFILMFMSGIGLAFIIWRKRRQ